MQLKNTTHLPARIFMTETPDPRVWRGCITAKATYRFDPSGEVFPQVDNALPILEADQDTRLGILSRDDMPPRQGMFQVILLGAAQPSRGRAVEQMRVTLQVGSTRQTLLVTGDRHWQGRSGQGGASRPVPFIRMPLTWARAFGGTRDVLVDRETIVEVTHHLNPAGRGFDPGPQANRLSQFLQAPAGYPDYDEHRLLPNLEDPAHPILSPLQNPDPACWATVPLASPLHMSRAVRSCGRGAFPDLSRTLPEAFYRAHPDWIISTPQRGALVRMRGLTPRGQVQFRLPGLCVQALYGSKSHRRSCELAPRVLVLLPDEGRFYLVFSHRFKVQGPHALRSVRLRSGQGWFRGGQRGARNERSIRLTPDRSGRAVG